MTEPVFSYSHKAADIRPPQGGRNKVYQWPGTKTWTLQPLNQTPDFAATDDWEGLKFRLTECTYDPDWWQEVPESRIVHADVPTNYDFFFSTVVKNTNVPDVPAVDPILKNLTDAWVQIGLALLDYQTSNLVAALYSNASLPKNQGYTLRWFQEGRPTYVRAAIMLFEFGDYALRINSDGSAELWQQSSDPETYGLVYVFSWTNSDVIHNHYHTITIFPHARKYIEFRARSTTWIDHLLNISDTAISSPASKQKAGEGLYELPGEPVADEDGAYTITEAGPWRLSISREYRTYIQVSRLGFANGTEGDAQLWDDYVHLTGLFGEDYTPTLPIQYNADYDANDGTVLPLVYPVGVGSNPIQFGFGMAGIGDVAGPGLGSTKTPELYSYTLRKPAVFADIPRTSLTTNVRSVRVDYGETPEAERMTVVIDNSCPGNPVDLYKRRGEIPLQIGDSETGICYFEGTAFETTAIESPSTAPRTLRLEAMGMADSLLRKYWFGLHNFGVNPDPEVAAGTAWTWADAVRACFEAAGFDPSTDVVIEEESLYNFALWPDTGVTHEQAVQQGSKWTPQPGTPIIEFLTYLLESILGWHWYWDRQSHQWRAYKRPDPMNPSDVDAGKFNPKASFYGNASWCGPAPVDDLPSYAHRNLTITTSRCLYSTVTTYTHLNESKIKTRDELKAMLADIQADPTHEDSAIKTEMKLVPCTVSNGNAVFGPSDHPDYLGTIRSIVVEVNGCANRLMQQWITRRLYDDNCHARSYAAWTSDWGDPYSAYLRKWDVVNLDTGVDHALEKWVIDRIEPEWTKDRLIQARYRASLFRPDCPPPRS